MADRLPISPQRAVKENMLGKSSVQVSDIFGPKIISRRSTKKTRERARRENRRTAQVRRTSCSPAATAALVVPLYLTYKRPTPARPAACQMHERQGGSGSYASRNNVTEVLQLWVDKLLSCRSMGALRLRLQFGRPGIGLSMHAIRDGWIGRRERELCPTGAPGGREWMS